MAPLFIAALCSQLGWIEGRMPDLLLIAAQIVIGSALGAQFRPEFLTRLFGLLRASCVVRAVRRPARWRCSAAGDRVARSAIRCRPWCWPMAPAGIAEMVLTGKLLGLDAT